MSGRRATGWTPRLGAVCVAMLLAACGGAGATEPGSAPTASSSSTSTTTASTVTASATVTTPTTTPEVDLFARPGWLGTRVLEPGPGGFGVVVPTPAELDPRQLRTPTRLADPPGDGFVSRVVPVPDEVLARSTWQPECPVPVEDLRYVTVTFWGFDGEHHTGELLVGASVADDVVSVFEHLDAARFPIEEMRITAAEELDLAPTGDGNNTSAFVCRAVRGGSSFSAHAFGTAIDVNPFHNPYVRGDVVLPELASTYLDRGNVRDGMIVAGSAPVVAFAEVGWEWGGAWDGSTLDPMHFSLTGT